LRCKWRLSQFQLAGASRGALGLLFA